MWVCLEVSPEDEEVGMAERDDVDQLRPDIYSLINSNCGVYEIIGQRTAAAAGAETRGGGVPRSLLPLSSRTLRRARCEAHHA